MNRETNPVNEISHFLHLLALDVERAGYVQFAAYARRLKQELVRNFNDGTALEIFRSYEHILFFLEALETQIHLPTLTNNVIERAKSICRESVACSPL